MNGSIRRRMLFLALILGCIWIQVPKLLAQTPLTLAVYQQELNGWLQRETLAKKASAEYQAINTLLKELITTTEVENNEVWQSIYELIETDEAGVATFREQLNVIKQQVENFEAIAADQKKAVQRELNQKVAAANKLKIRSLTEFYLTLTQLEQKMVLINLKYR